MTFKEYSVVRLRRSIPGAPVSLGAIGAVVTVYDEAKAYEVEFCDSEGVTLALLTLQEDDLERT